MIANIAQTLIEVPRFYTQVIHLMNKMNLPPPFQPKEDLSPLYQYLSQVLGYKGPEVAANTLNVEGDIQNVKYNNHDASDHESSESESELESEGEAEKSVKARPVPIKRRLRPPNTIRKKPKLSLLKQTCVFHPRAPEYSLRDVFEAAEAQVSRRLEVRLKDTILPKKDAGNSGNSGSFGKMEALSTESKDPSSVSMVEWEREADKYIKREEILNNRIAKSGNS